MKKTILIVLGLIIIVIAAILINKPKPAPTEEKTTMTTEENQPQMQTEDDFKITPISHATLMLHWEHGNILTDPVGDVSMYKNLPNAEIILITDIHGDHLSTSTLADLVKEDTTLIVPSAVAELLPESLKTQSKILANGQTADVNGYKIEAIPMYNWPLASDAYHTKGRGNGYIVEHDGKRIYISGDTGAIPEMKALKNIDLAFVCMNLPYTMSVEDAAAAVLEFKPRTVVPYHYRGPNGLSDINKFKTLVNQGDPNITVELMNFYPQQ